jgi:hypothetical protein
MMIKKLRKQFVQNIAEVTCTEIEWAIRHGIVSASAGDDESPISSPIYEDSYDASSRDYDIWKQLLVVRSLHDSGGSTTLVFEDVAEIASAFGYPEDMNELIYYMPTQEEGSEDKLIKKIVEYASSLDRKGSDT